MRCRDIGELGGRLGQPDSQVGDEVLYRPIGVTEVAGDDPLVP
jgi:hypothetical protein